MLGFAGLAIALEASWARWFTIVVGLPERSAPAGVRRSSQYPLWALTVLVLNVVVLYALIVRWGDVPEPGY